MAGRILVGTSSWADPGFIKEWYPPKLPAGQRLGWYAERFEAVELNASFYAVPERDTVRRWVEVTPDEFTFDVKLHRLLSRHSAGPDSLPPSLRERARTTPRGRVVLDEELEDALIGELLDAIEPLESAGKLGALLLQTTPAFRPRRPGHEGGSRGDGRDRPDDPPAEDQPAADRLVELEPLVAAVAPRKLALELRNRHWVEGEQLSETLAWCSERDVAFVCVDAPPGDHFSIMPAVDAVTRDDLAYVRLHGRDTHGYLTGKSVAERFGWVYGDDELEEVAGRVRNLADQAAEVHVLFNNNRDDDAPSAARRFRALLGQDPGPPSDDGQLRLS
ncbi:MAG TPA: DUF72 domain-containing protein [Solirubrobacteraceae bacterium]|nr:DUF72 domain-containing protein [Solirubrobacteraceae bacterium]